MQKIKLQIVTILLIISFLFLVLPHQTIGNFFFERNSTYNINLAQFFFEKSAYPLFGKAAPYAHHQLSRTYFIQGDLDIALAEAYKELEVYPDHKATYYIIGLTLGYMNKNKEAIEAFSSYIEYNPKTWAARNDKAWLQFKIGDIDGAITTLTPVVEKQEHNVWVQNTFCVLMLNKKEYLKARQACDKAHKVAFIMTEESWGLAYPGNDPRIYKIGLTAMRKSIANNLNIISSKGY